MHWAGFIKQVAICLMACSATLLFATELLVLGSPDQPLWQQWLRARTPLTFPLRTDSPEESLEGFLIGSTTAMQKPSPTTPLTSRCRTRVHAVITTDLPAARSAIKACPLPVLFVGIPSQALDSLLADAKKYAVPAVAIRLEAEPRLNLQLMRVMSPQSRKIGLLRPSTDPGWLSPLREEARRLRFELQDIVADGDLEAVRALRVQLIGLDAVLLPPDPTLINEWSLKPLLLMTARQGIPVFGALTARYVEAGVMASVVADENGLFDQAIGLARTLGRKPLSSTVYPSNVRVVINSNIAQILGFSSETLARAQSLFKRP